MLAKFTLKEVLTRSAKEYASNLALSSVDGIGVTYKELKEKVNSISTFLSEQGIIPGDKVAILSENSVNWGIAYFAITTMGAVGVPIMTEFKSTEIKHILKHSESKAVFVSSRQFEKIEEYGSTELGIRILLDDFSIIPDDTKTDKLKLVVSEGLKEFQKIKLAALKMVGFVDEEIGEDDLALILYTSGTTGHSKGVMLTHKNLIYDATETVKLAGIKESDRMLSILPFNCWNNRQNSLYGQFAVRASIYRVNPYSEP